MLNKIITTKSTDDRKSSNQKKRHCPRRSSDHCVSIINGQMHPVENWSSGGMLVTADDKLFAINQEYSFTLKFKLREEIMEIDHRAKIVRKSHEKIALQFLPLSKKINYCFQKVVDDFVSMRFVESQK